ncbi:unnamed protein product [Moneuplotes crassus]|uniref:Uncharacterized protein n=1 Tax=Euplotes crassus TaxID=5936 RepID=A0AAD1UCN7_EUPCR|nr:unnamed protein product [Moneuplotes crassus]
MDHEYFSRSRADKYGLNNALKQRTQQFWKKNNFTDKRNLHSSFTFRNLGITMHKSQIKEMAQKHKLGPFSSLGRKGSTALKAQKKILEKDFIKSPNRSRKVDNNSRRITSLTELQKKEIIDRDEIRIFSPILNFKKPHFNNARYDHEEAKGKLKKSDKLDLVHKKSKKAQYLKPSPSLSQSPVKSKESKQFIKNKNFSPEPRPTQDNLFPSLGTSLTQNKRALKKKKLEPIKTLQKWPSKKLLIGDTYIRKFQASEIATKNPSVTDLIVATPLTKSLDAKALRRKFSNKAFRVGNVLEKTATNRGTFNYLNEETDDSISTEELESESSQQLFIGKYDSFIIHFDEESRTIISKRVRDREIRFGNLSLGDDFICKFADQLKKDHNIHKILINNNRITSRGAMAILNKVSYSTNYLNLSGNPDIKVDSYKFLSKYVLQDYRKKIVHLNLEGNSMGDYSIGIICTTLADDSYIKYLNLSKNCITDRGAAALGYLIYNNRSIASLFVSWNEFKGEGGKHIADGLKENAHIKVFDMSFNSIGSMHFQKHNCIKYFSEAFKINNTLVHVDMSYLGLIKKDLELLNQGLKHNHSILGIHMLGNEGGVDSLGYLSTDLDPPSSSQLISTISPMLKAGEVDPKNLDLQRCTNCWICEGWTPITFRFIHKNSSHPHIKLKEKATVLLHLGIDNFEPDIMYPDKDNPGEYYKVRMVPATDTYFYFTVDELPQVRTDIDTIACDSSKIPRIEKIEERNATMPWKVNAMLCGPQNQIVIYCDLLENLNCLPRPKKFKAKKKKQLKIKPKFEISKSVFKKYQNEGTKLIERCFEFDWKCSKIEKVIKSEEERILIKKYLKSNYRIIREAYKYFAGISPCGIVPGIGQNAFNEIVNATHICDNKRLKLADIDFEFIVTKSGNKKALNPERWLIRYQFMEIFVRLALHMYFKSKIVETQSESVVKLMDEKIMPFFNKFDCHKWRVEHLWNLECETVLIKYIGVLQRVYNRYSGMYTLPGRVKFMSIDEFITLINDSQVLSNEVGVGNSELGAQFNLSMSTQVDEVEKDRHCQMMFFEFLEAIARVSYKISSFPDVDKQILFKKENGKKEASMMRNRGSSLDTSDSEDVTKEEVKEDAIEKYYNALVKPLHVKIEILIKYLQICALEGRDINMLEGKDNSFDK